VFDGNSYGDEMSLFDAEFSGIPFIKLATEDDKLKFNITGTRFVIHRCAVGSRIVRRLQTLKSIADATNSLNESRDLFIMQRQVELRTEKTRVVKSLRKPSMQAITTTVGFAGKGFLMAAYGWLSNFGRSYLWPVFWFVLLNLGFYRLYLQLYDGVLFAKRKQALAEYTMSNAVPFGKLLNPAFDSAVNVLFGQTTKVGGAVNATVEHINIPFSFQVLGICQNLLSVLLIFLALLAVRNYFKIG
jgi:hypothetical protein